MSVPFAALALWVQEQHLKALWAILATVCFLTASYRVWRNERVAAQNLQSKLDAYKRWEFEAELLSASRSVYTYENASPFVAVHIGVRVHNRNPQPTTVTVRSISVKTTASTDAGFQPATITPGGHFDFDNPEEYHHYSVPGSGSTDLLLYSRRFNPPDFEQWIAENPLPVTVTLSETFGNVCQVTGDLKLAGISKS